VEQQKRRRVLQASLSVKDGEPIDLRRAIESRVSHFGVPFFPFVLPEETFASTVDVGYDCGNPNINHD
jgi:hypothetical protein